MLLTLLACGNQPQDVRVGTLSVGLENPTTVDAFDGVETLRVQVATADAVVAEQDFAVTDAIELPDVTEFGAVQVRLTGLDGTRNVLSYGQTAWVDVVEGQDQAATMLFLPVDRELPLDFPFLNRQDHVAVPLDDGVLLLGGGPDNSEVFQLTALSQRQDSSPTAMGLRWAAAEDFVLVAGGTDDVGGEPKPVRRAVAVDPATSEVTELPGMIDPRALTCASMFRPEFGLVVGTEQASETLRRDPESGEWEWTRVLIGDLDGREVTNCVETQDGRILMLGPGSGVFDFRPETATQNPKIAEAYTAFVVEGERGLEVRPNVVWTDAGLELELDTQGVRESVAPLEPPQAVAQLEPGVAVVLGETTLEILDLEAMAPLTLVDMSPREGARLSVLNGLIVVSGPTPALVQPSP